MLILVDIEQEVSRSVWVTVPDGATDEQIRTLLDEHVNELTDYSDEEDTTNTVNFWHRRRDTDLPPRHEPIEYTVLDLEALAVPEAPDVHEPGPFVHEPEVELSIRGWDGEE